MASGPSRGAELAQPKDLAVGCDGTGDMDTKGLEFNCGVHVTIVHPQTNDAQPEHSVTVLRLRGVEKRFGL